MSTLDARTQHAERLLEDEVLKEAFSAVINQMLAEIATSPSEAADKRESCYRNIVAVDRVRGMLRQFVNDGKLAAAAIERGQRIAQ